MGICWKGIPEGNGKWKAGTRGESEAGRGPLCLGRGCRKWQEVSGSERQRGPGACRQELWL